MGEQLVHGGDELARRAIVRPKLVVAAVRGPARRQIAVDVRAAEAVDRLLRVADEEQAVRGVVVGHAVQLVEDAVLVGRRVLEFVDHRHRILVEDAPAQRLAVRPLQRILQARQHVGEAELAVAALQFRHAVRDGAGGVAQQRVRYRRNRIEPLFQRPGVLEALGNRRGVILAERIENAIGCQTGPQRV
ncbi:conserved hypothetical protein, partial [Ricinus communis]